MKYTRYKVLYWKAYIKKQVYFVVVVVVVVYVLGSASKFNDRIFMVCSFCMMFSNSKSLSLTHSSKLIYTTQKNLLAFFSAFFLFLLGSFCFSLVTSLFPKHIRGRRASSEITHCISHLLLWHTVKHWFMYYH